MPSLFHDKIVNNGHPKRLVIGITVLLISVLIGMTMGMSFIKIDEKDTNGKTTRNQTNFIGFFVMFGLLIATLVVLMLIQPVGLWHDIKLKLKVNK